MLGCDVLTIKEYLKQALTMKQLINAKKSLIEQTKDKLSILGLSSLQDNIEQDNAEKDNEVIAAKKEISDDIKELKTEVIRLYAMQKEMQAFIELIKDDDCRLLLFERYVLLEDWKDIMKKEYYRHYSEKHIFKIHKKGVRHLLRIMIENGITNISK